MKYYILASGSKGNSAVFQTNDGHLLQIDMGVSLKYEKTQLAKYSINFNDIEALLVTHEHSDHIKGISAFDPSIIYCAKGTYEVPKANILEHYKVYTIAGFKITILPTSHDAINPIGFVLEADQEKLIYMTDTGYISQRNLNYMENPDYICIESNHNVKMLFETNRPAQLIMRIIGDYGHLSNEDSAMYISEIIGDKTKEIVLMHLSEEANTHDLAVSSFKKTLQSRKIDIHSIYIRAAYQYESISSLKVKI